MKSLQILFAGTVCDVTLIDDSRASVFVRTIPQRFLGRVLSCAEFQTALIELCTYLPAEPATAGSLPSALDSQLTAAAHPDIPPPAGYAPVPLGWTDNLSDASIALLYEKAKELNFPRAVDWAKGQIAAKKLVAPLQEMAIAQVTPLVDRLVEPLMRKLETLSASTPSAPSSSVSAATSSSTKRSSGSKK